MTPVLLAQSPRSYVQRVMIVVVAVALAMLAGSCSLSRPTEAKRMFLLEPKMPAAATGTPKPEALRMGVVNVAAPFRGKTFVYRESDLRYDTDYYDEFFIAPAVMVADATAKALAASNVFRRVVPFGASSVEGDYVLDGFVSELYADTRNAAAPVAVITVTYYLTPANAINPGVVWTHTYEQRAKAAGAGAEAIANGWNTALTAIVAELARDLAAASLPKP